MVRLPPRKGISTPSAKGALDLVLVFAPRIDRQGVGARRRPRPPLRLGWWGAPEEVPEAIPAGFHPAIGYVLPVALSNLSVDYASYQ